MPRQDYIPKWLKLLGDEAKQKQSLFEKHPENYILDHPDQTTIHKDCQSLESKSPIFLESELKNTLERLLTYYCKTEEISYQSGLHEILAPFFIMKFNNLKTVYGAFCAFVDKMMPKIFHAEKILDYGYNIFQKLMMYHEPLTFNTLQASFPGHAQIVKKWLLTSMASCLETIHLIKFWEYCLSEQNLTLPIFIAISILYRQRDKFMKKNKSKKVMNLDEIEIDNIEDLIKEAVSYQQSTPKSFEKIIKKVLIIQSTPKSYLKNFEKYSILKISRKEILGNPSNYIIIDTRSLDSYLKGHFTQSFNLSLDLSIATGKLLYRLEELWSILSGFTTYFQNKNNRNCHLAFICEAADFKTINNLCLDLVRRGIEKLSLISAVLDLPHLPDCLKCKFAKEVHKFCKDQDDKKQILSMMWESYLQELNSDGGSSLSKVKDSLIFNDLAKDLSGISMYECLKVMWTSNLLDAENWFESRKDEDPRCALHFAEAGFLKALLLGDNGSKEVVTERLIGAEKVASDHVKFWKVRGNQIFNFSTIDKSILCEVIKASQQLRLGLAVKAEATLFKSGTELTQRKLTTGSVNFRRAWKLYQKAKKIEKVQRLAEKEIESEELNLFHNGIESDIKSLISFGEGVINLGLSMAPTSMSKVARAAMGIEIDQTKGIKQLYNCINLKMGIRVPLALMFLTFWLLIYIPDYTPGKKERLREAHGLIRFSLHYYQQSPFFYWLESYLNQKQGNFERSLKLLNRVISRSQKLGLNVAPGRLNFERGWILFLCQEWPSAVKCLEESYNSGSATAFAKLVMGVCYCMTGNLNGAQTILEELEKASPNTSERWVSRRASRYLQRRRFQIFAFELIYVTDSLSVLKNEWLESCLEYIGNISMDIETQEEIEEKAIWLLLKGTIFRLMGRLQQSVAALQEGISFENSIIDEVWVIPHLYYELAMDYAKSRDWESSTNFIKMARTYKKKYEFSNALSFKLNSAMDLAMQEENKEFNK